MTDGQILTFWHWVFWLSATSSIFNGLGFLLFGFGTPYGFIGFLSSVLAYLSWVQVKKIDWM